MGFSRRLFSQCAGLKLSLLNAKSKTEKKHLVRTTYPSQLPFAGLLLIFLMSGCGLKYMSPKTLEPQVLSGLKESESIVWGQLDDSEVHFLEEANCSQIDPNIAREAESQKQSVRMPVDSFLMSVGALDMGAANRQVELTFTNVETGAQIRTQNAAGISGDFPFYVILPRGRYTLDVRLIWPRSEYQAQAEGVVTSTGGANAIYIGHLHMGITDRTSYGLFDVGDFDKASEWFRSKHPTFQGSLTEQRVAEQVILVDKDGRRL